MTLNLLLRYIDFDEDDDFIGVTLTDSYDEFESYDDFRKVPSKYLKREVRVFAPTAIGDRFYLWVELCDED